jgi:SAM-dependent methyltransferase
MITTNTDKFMETNAYLDQYSAENEISKYTWATAGSGINYLLDHDYKAVYLEALNLLPEQTCQDGIRILEFGCGGGMNLLRLVSTVKSSGIHIAQAIGTDFSPAMVETARREAKDYLRGQDSDSLQFCVARNESLISDISTSAGIDKSSLQNSFHFVLGVNTIRYSHDANKERDCVRDIFNLLVPGGICVVIDMNNRFPLFRSDLRNRVRRKRETVLCPILGRVRGAIRARRVRVTTNRAFLLGSSFRQSSDDRDFSHVIPDLEYGRSLEGHEVVSRRQEAVIVPDCL